MITKTELSRLLNLSWSTMFRYHDLAFVNISDFANDYPRLDDKSYTRSKLTNYQCWVIASIYKDFRGTNFKITEHLLSTDEVKARYSKITYFKTANKEYGDSSLVLIAN